MVLQPRLVTVRLLLCRLLLCSASGCAVGVQGAGPSAVLVAQPFVANVRMTETLSVALHANLHSAATARWTAIARWVPTTCSQCVWVRLLLAPAESTTTWSPHHVVLCRYCLTCVLLCRHTCHLPLSAPVVTCLVISNCVVSHCQSLLWWWHKHSQRPAPALCH